MEGFEQHLGIWGPSHYDDVSAQPPDQELRMRDTFVAYRFGRQHTCNWGKQFRLAGCIYTRVSCSKLPQHKLAVGARPNGQPVWVTWGQNKHTTVSNKVTLRLAADTSKAETRRAP